MLRVYGSGDVILKGVRGYRLDDLSIVYDGYPSFVVPTNFEFDGASIPQILWSIVGHPFQVGFRRAAAVHDYALIHHNIPHKIAHKIFYQLLRIDGVGVIRASFMYGGVVVYWAVKDGVKKNSR